MRGVAKSGVRVFAAFATLFLAACSAGNGLARSDETLPPVALLTSLPILWHETHELSDYLESGQPEHWARPVMERGGPIMALDSLAPSGEVFPVPSGTLLIMAQPYPLSPEEYVALDDWVRSGGRVLLFADPMLTADSAFALGDRRRPQDIAVLTPILTRWGLALRFNPERSIGEQTISIEGGKLPVNLPGSFLLLSGSSHCMIEVEGLLAECGIGEGRLLAVADAALLEGVGDEDQKVRADMLARLIRRISR